MKKFVDEEKQYHFRVKGKDVQNIRVLAQRAGLTENMYVKSLVLKMIRNGKG